MRIIIVKYGANIKFMDYGVNRDIYISLIYSNLNKTMNANLF